MAKTASFEAASADPAAGMTRVSAIGGDDRWVGSTPPSSVGVNPLIATMLTVSHDSDVAARIAPSLKSDLR